jgi:hypothetical protein
MTDTFMSNCDLTMSLTACMAGVTAKVVIDTGSSMNVVSYAWVQAASLQVLPSSLTISFGDAHDVPALGEVTVHFKCQSYQKKLSFVVAQLPPGIDALLGDEWLNQGQVVLDYSGRSVFLIKGNRRMSLILDSGVQCSQDGTKIMINAVQVKRAIRKEARLCLILVSEKQGQETKVGDDPGVDTELDQILKEYSDVS